MTADSRRAAESTAGRRTLARLLAVLAAGVVPWSVQTYAAGPPTFVFSWGLLNVAPLHATTIVDFLLRFTAALPDFVLAWPLGVACYLVAVGSALSGVLFAREDRRLTATGLVLAGATQLELSRGFSVQPGRTAWPLGTVVLLAVAGYVYWSR